MAAVAPLHILPNLTLLTRTLRRLGIDAGPGHTASLARAWGRIDLTRPQEAKAAARAVLCSRREEVALFNQAYDLFLQAARHRGPVLDLGDLLQQVPGGTPEEREGRETTVTEAPLLGSGKGAEEVEEREEPYLERRFTYSEREILRRKDFALLTPEEGREVRRMMLQEVFDPGRRRTRRRAPSPRGGFLDLRRTLRGSLSTGGEALRLARRQRREKRRPLVALCDVSGSMEGYSRMLLQFLYTLRTADHRVETFAFATRLTRLTRPLTHRDVDRALQDAAAAVRDWGGGTRIGEALHTFHRRWGRRVLGQGATVLIISDGWDRGEPELLHRGMERLRHSCHRILWLNPLLAQPGFEPLTRGLQAALPHVHDFRTLHNLESLGHLRPALAGN